MVKLEVNASDDIELDRVEFYWNDQIISTQRGDGPYSAEWRIVQLGEQSFYVIAYDAAGNTTKSDVLKVAVGN